MQRMLSCPKNGVWCQIGKVLTTQLEANRPNITVALSIQINFGFDNYSYSLAPLWHKTASLKIHFKEAWIHSPKLPQCLKLIM